MSTTKHMEKENQRSEALGNRLEDLYRRGADEAFLDLVHERCRSLPELPAAALHGEVVDRALRRALMGRDWHQTGRILKRLRRDLAGDRPMVRLAEAVLHLVEGRLDEARAGLAGLTEEGNGASPVPACLVTALEALTELAVPGDPYLHELGRRLELLREQGFQARPQDIRSFEVILSALETGISGDAMANKLLSAAGERLRLLDLLGILERDLLRDHEGGLTALEIFKEETSEEHRSLLEAFRSVPPWSLVRPLHHAARLAWRGLLRIVAEKEGPEAWAEIASLWPELLYLDLEGEHGARSLAAGRLWREWKESLGPGHIWNLADFLESKSRGEKDPERLAALWEAELWARRREARLDPGSGGAAKAALARLERFAIDAGRRLPPEPRLELAHRLREGLLDLCELDGYCRCFLTAATALLEHLEDDPAVLAVALVSAVCARDDRAVDRLTERIAARGVASEEEQEAVFEVISHLAKEEWTDIARCLPRLQPLLDGRRRENAVPDEDEEDDEEDWEENPVTDESMERVRGLLERLFPPPRLIMKPLEPAPEPLQPKDLEPLLRPMRRQAVEEALRAGLKP